MAEDIPSEIRLSSGLPGLPAAGRQPPRVRGKVPDIHFVNQRPPVSWEQGTGGGEAKTQRVDELIKKRD